MDKDPPLITVSVVSHGDSQKVLHLLESMGTFEQIDTIQMIVTDNLGNEIQEIEDTPWESLLVIHNKRRYGFAQNHNHAFQFAKGKYFCLLNPDVVFTETVFTHLIKRLESNQADIIAPLIVDSKGIVQDSFRNIPSPLEIVLRRLPGYKFDYSIAESTPLIRPEWLSGIFLFIRSDTYRISGGLSEKYRLYFEDVEFCTRARLAGLKLGLDTRVFVQHDAHRASRKKLIYLFWHIQSAIRFFTSPIYKKALQMSKEKLLSKREDV